jgi:periplasmic protein TonB
MIRDKHYFKAFQMSLTVHALLIFIVIGTGYFLKTSDKLLVVDFCMEDSPNSGDKTLTASEIKTQRDIIRQKAGTAKEDQKKQKDQEPTNEEQRQGTPVHTTPEIPETTVSEKPQVISQINPDTVPDDTVKNFVMLAGSQNNSSGSTSTPDGSTYVKGDITRGNTNSYEPGSGGPKGLKAAEYLQKNFFYIRDMIQKRIIYPALARRMGWEGKVIASFIVSSGGYARDIRISKSSGHELLDENVLKAINNSSPFPKPPIEAQIIIPILYRLN